MKTILITGGSGFLGKRLASKLSNKYNIVLGSRNNNQNRLANLETSCEVVPLDITSKESINDIFYYIKPDIIIHAAATKYVDISETYPHETIDVNILGSQNIARASIKNNIETVIGISTDKTAPPIGNIYGLSKAVMERLFLSLNNKSDTNFTCVRFGNIAWSTGSVFPIWEEMTKKNKLIYSTGPDMRRFFFNCDEASDLVIRSLNHINLTSGKILIQDMKCAKISDILDIWCKIFNCKWKKVKKRLGDKQDEYLIGELEYLYAKKIIINKIIHYLLDFNKICQNPLKKTISTINAKRLNNKEIAKLIKYKVNE
tara:strand:- start:1224 stop:2168 length:945 start_codon:yes stop_codon:yes gene_type:complete